MELGTVAVPGPSWKFVPLGQVYQSITQTSCTKWLVKSGIEESIPVSIITRRGARTTSADAEGNKPTNKHSRRIKP